VGGNTQGSGNVKTESRQVSGITSVQLDTSGDLTLSQGETESLTIEAEDNVLPFLTSDVNNGTLTLAIKLDSTSPTKPIKYTLTVKNIVALSSNSSGSIKAGDLVSASGFQATLSSSGSLDLSSIKSDKVSVGITGSGSATIASLNTQSLTTDLTGNGKLTVSGQATDQLISVSGSGDFNGENLVSKTAVATTNSPGNILIQVSDKLVATTSGSGGITYIGNPSVTQNSTGSGKITQKS